MDLSALLGGNFGGAGGAAGGGGSLVEVRAGMMTRTGTTITSDKRKGMVRLFKGPDQILHFAWKERSKSQLELDLLLFPGDAEVFALPSPPATGRCFALRFKTNSGIHFFWLQDPKAEKDAQLMTDMNNHLGSPEANAATESAAPEAVASEAVTTPAAGESTSAGDGDDEDAALAAALAMSMEGATPAQEEAVSPGDDEEAAALEAALAMSMEAGDGGTAAGEEDKKDGDDDLDADLYD